MANEASYYSLAKSLGLCGLSACIAEAATLPLDTAKVRLQLQNRSTAGARALGPIGTVRQIYTSEGAAALWKGLEAGAHRQLIFTGLRIGLYGQLLDQLSGEADREKASLGARIGAALTTSAIGISVANPSDVVKVRTQASSSPAVPMAPFPEPRTVTSRPRATAFSPHSMLCKPMGGPSTSQASNAQRTLATRAASSTLYEGSAFRVYQHIIRTEGVLGGLYSGFTPNLIRNSIISASELVAYDVSKRKYGQLGVPDGPGLHMLSGLTAGLIATILGNPMDVVSTRIMVHKATGGNDNMVEACRTMLLKEGIFSFYQGFVPNFCRIGSFNVVLWMSLEHLRTLFG